MLRSPIREEVNFVWPFIDHNIEEVVWLIQNCKPLHFIFRRSSRKKINGISCVVVQIH